MDPARDALARENAALKAALAVAQTEGLEVAAELAVARAKASEDTALIAQQKLRIAKLERQIYGQKSERSARLIDQLALAFEELEASATEDELAAEMAVAQTTTVRGFTRQRPERNTFPEHLLRERVVIDPPATCECCGGERLLAVLQHCLNVAIVDWGYPFQGNPWWQLRSRTHSVLFDTLVTGELRHA